MKSHKVDNILQTMLREILCMNFEGYDLTNGADPMAKILHNVCDSS